jgi:cell shape-determining protein MreC
MIRKTPKPFLLLFAAILFLISIPKGSSEKFRGATASLLSPAWGSIALGTVSLQNLVPSSDERSNPSGKEMQRLQLENQQYALEIARLQELIQHERYLNKQLNAVYNKTTTASSLESLQKNQRQDLQKLLALQLEAVPAQVVFRSPSTWNSSLWLNVGTANNHTLGQEVIAKNSPVVVGASVVGVVDYVGMHQSRVRLITDSGLTPSVRAQRGPYLFLAKGELHGSSKPLWRSYGDHLQGVGFNFDFADEAGPARDLRTGMPINGTGKEPIIPILKVHDLLVTTGMDGVFPAGLHVAEVTSIHTLKEGDYYYELEAKPTAGNLQELSLVFVMPPLGYDPLDQPPAIGR